MFLLFKLIKHLLIHPKTLPALLLVFLCYVLLLKVRILVLKIKTKQTEVQVNITFSYSLGVYYQ